MMMCYQSLDWLRLVSDIACNYTNQSIYIMILS